MKLKKWQIIKYHFWKYISLEGLNINTCLTFRPKQKHNFWDKNGKKLINHYWKYLKDNKNAHNCVVEMQTIINMFRLNIIFDMLLVFVWFFTRKYSRSD